VPEVIDSIVRVPEPVRQYAKVIRNKTEIPPNICVGRLHGQRFLEAGDGLIMLALNAEDIAQRVVSLGIVRIQVNTSLKVDRSIVQAIHFFERNAKVIQRLRIIRFFLQSGFDPIDGKRKSPRLNTQETQQIIGVYMPGVLCDDFSVGGLCASQLTGLMKLKGFAQQGVG